MTKKRAMTPQMRHILKHLNMARELRADWERIASDRTLSRQERLDVRRRWIERAERLDFEAIDHFLDRILGPERSAPRAMRH